MLRIPLRTLEGPVLSVCVSVCVRASQYVYVPFCRCEYACVCSRVRVYICKYSLSQVHTLENFTSLPGRGHISEKGLERKKKRDYAHLGTRKIATPI
jgi:hypothetical protein